MNAVKRLLILTTLSSQADRRVDSEKFIEIGSTTNVMPSELVLIATDGLGQLILIRQLNMRSVEELKRKLISFYIGSTMRQILSVEKEEVIGK